MILNKREDQGRTAIVRLKQKILCAAKRLSVTLLTGRETANRSGGRMDFDTFRPNNAPSPATGDCDAEQAMMIERLRLAYAAEVERLDDLQRAGGCPSEADYQTAFTAYDRALRALR